MKINPEKKLFNFFFSKLWIEFAQNRLKLIFINIKQMEVALDSLPSYVPPASASIRNLSLTSSSLRVHLRPLLADIPFVGAVTISFLQPPEIDFDLVIILSLIYIRTSDTILIILAVGYVYMLYM